MPQNPDKTQNGKYKVPKVSIRIALHLQSSTVAAIADGFYFLQLSILVSVVKGPMRDSSVPLLHGLMSCFLISNTLHYTHLPGGHYHV